ncbi:MAG: tyrosine-type recombinase/integrase [Limisphaerales bacterium]
MATCLFRSPLAPRIQAFLQTRQAAGHWYRSNEKILVYLDRFLTTELEPGQPITREIVERWFASMAHLSLGTRINRISVLRQFCRYLSYFDPRTCIIHRSFQPRRTRPAPHIYTHKEVRQIMAAARRIGPPGSFRPVVISVLVGLLHATGLRIGEALALTIADVDLRRRVIHVRKSKFKKSRLVPLSSSTAEQLMVYLCKRRKAGFPTVSTSSLFVSRTGRAYGEAAFTAIFLQVIRQIGIRGPKGQRGPRVHDLRHTFAVNRLLTWYRQGANLSAKLPLLSTYLGHTTITGTEVYLHATAELLESTGKRFHSHFAIPLRKRKVRHVEG